MTRPEDTYLTISSESQGSYKEKGSKFYARAYPVKGEEEIKPILETLRKQFHDARHHCYAWRLGADHSLWRANDDGEPSGSAGMPILGQIKSFELTDILIVVIRYFGGTKLGISGLINAYRTASREAIQANKIIEKQIVDIYEIQFSYPSMNEVMTIIKNEKLDQFDQDFGLDCRLKIRIRQTQSERIRKIFEKLREVDIRLTDCE